MPTTTSDSPHRHPLTPAAAGGQQTLRHERTASLTAYSLCMFVLALAACSKTSSPHTPQPPAPPTSPVEAKLPRAFPDAKAGCFGSLCVGQPLPSSLPAGLSCKPAAPSIRPRPGVRLEGLVCAGSVYQHALWPTPLPRMYFSHFDLADGKLSSFRLAFRYAPAASAKTMCEQVTTTHANLLQNKARDERGWCGTQLGIRKTAQVVALHSASAETAFQFHPDHWLVTMQPPGELGRVGGEERVAVFVHMSPDAISTELLNEIAAAAQVKSLQDAMIAMVQTNVMMIHVPARRIAAVSRLAHVGFVQRVYPVGKLADTALRLASARADEARNVVHELDLQTDEHGRLELIVVTNKRCASTDIDALGKELGHRGVQVREAYENRIRANVAVDPLAFKRNVSWLAQSECVTWLELKGRDRIKVRG